MIRLENLSKSFPDGDLFNNVNISIKRGMRIGLVGPNGSGKTTLLRIMMGKESPDSGNVQVDKSTTIGYLVVGAHFDCIDIVCVDRFVGRWHRPAFTDVRGMVGSEEQRGAGAFIVAGGIQGVGGAGRCNCTEAMHPLAVSLHRRNVD